MPQVRLEVDGRRYFMSGDTVIVRDTVCVVADVVPIRLDDGTVITVPRDEAEHVTD